MGIKVKQLFDTEGNHGAWIHECPGCGCGHAFDNRWTFDGNLESPTFSPSMLVNQHREKNRYGTPSVRCHYFLKAGKIQFLSDCDHDLKNQTVDCPDY